MGNIRPKVLSKLGYTDNVARSLAIELVAKHCKHHSQEDVIRLLQDIIQSPEEYKQDAVWGRLAETLSPTKAEVTTYELQEKPLPYIIYGAEQIDKLAKSQMEMAMRLHATLSGALMPDGCAGYGLPIGGVLATTDYAVGKDIGCRMSLTILDAGIDYLGKHHDRAVEALLNNTAFGLDGILPFKQYHPLLDKSEFREIPLLKRIMGRINRHFLDVVTAINVVDSAEFAPWVGCLVFGFQGPGNQEGT